MLPLTQPPCGCEIFFSMINLYWHHIMSRQEFIIADIENDEMFDMLFTASILYPLKELLLLLLLQLLLVFYVYKQICTNTLVYCGV